MLVEWNSQECEKSTPQNDYDLLIKFVVDRATFFILSTPPFRSGRLFRFCSGLGPAAPGLIFRIPI